MVGAPAFLDAQDAAPKASPGAPRAKVAEAERDLGVKAVGDLVSAEFRIRNPGDQDLELYSFKAAPGIRIEGVPGKVPAGGTLTVRLILFSPPPPGPVLAEATIRTNDVVNPDLRIALKAEVQAFLLLHPGYARYIVVQLAADGTIRQTVGSSDATAFRVLKVESPHPSLRVTFREARPDERQASWKGVQWRVEATLLKDAPVGALTGNLVIHTDHPKQRVAKAPVSGFVRPIFAVTPPEVRMGDLELKAPGRTRLVIKNYAVETIALRGVESNVAGVRGELNENEPGRSWSLTLWVDEDKAAGPFEGRLRIRTASPNVPAIDVPISGRIVRAGPKAIPSPTPGG